VHSAVQALKSATVLFVTYEAGRQAGVERRETREAQRHACQGVVVLPVCQASDNKLVIQPAKSHIDIRLHWQVPAQPQSKQDRRSE
jgi:hypothetical protein